MLYSQTARLPSCKVQPEPRLHASQKGSSPALMRRKQVAARAVAEETVQRRPASTTVNMEERMAFLAEDLTQNLFGGRGIDTSQYDTIVDFSDPITKYNNAKGYMFNIRMLKTVFNPTFFLHGIKQTGEYECTTRWTMLMRPTFIPSVMTSLWDPTLIFTGTSVMGVNPENGKFNRHIDYWDSVANNDYFSLEAMGKVFQQISIFGNPKPAENLMPFDILLKGPDWEVCRYKPFHAVVSASSATPSEQLEAVEGYLAGDNLQQRTFPRVSPLFQGERRGETGSFLVAPLEAEPSSGKALGSFSAPQDSRLRLVTLPPTLCIASFSREPSSAEAERAFQQRVSTAVGRLEGKGTPAEPRFGILSGGWERSEWDGCTLRELRSFSSSRPRPKWTNLRSVDLASVLEL